MLGLLMFQQGLSSHMGRTIASCTSVFWKWLPGDAGCSQWDCGDWGWHQTNLDYFYLSMLKTKFVLLGTGKAASGFWWNRAACS